MTRETIGLTLVVSVFSLGCSSQGGSPGPQDGGGDAPPWMSPPYNDPVDPVDPGNDDPNPSDPPPDDGTGGDDWGSEDPLGGGPWSMNAAEHRGRHGETMPYTCPAPGTANPIWGTDVYTDDSSVCTAAVHAGVITLEAGGMVMIRVREGVPNYVGSTQNGVTSGAWDQMWQGSFEIVR